VSQVDFCASFAALTGQTLGAGDAPDSFNVLPALLGESPLGREQVLEHSNQVAIRKGQWKFIPGTTGAGSKKADAKRPAKAADALYDLANDPSETTNIADKPENAATVTRLRAQLDALMK
jgi:arylsulfatase A-like enzyme